RIRSRAGRVVTRIGAPSQISSVGPLPDPPLPVRPAKVLSQDCSYPTPGGTTSMVTPPLEILDFGMGKGKWQMANGKWQKAEGKRQKAEGGRQKAKGRRRLENAVTERAGQVSGCQKVGGCFRLGPFAFCLFLYLGARKWVAASAWPKPCVPLS